MTDREINQRFGELRSLGKSENWLKDLTSDERKEHEELLYRYVVNQLLANKLFKEKIRSLSEDYLEYHTKDELSAICEDQKADFEKRAKVRIVHCGNGEWYGTIDWLEK